MVQRRSKERRRKTDEWPFIRRKIEKRAVDKKFTAIDWIVCVIH
jgi:hypothetical protein